MKLCKITKKTKEELNKRITQKGNAKMEKDFLLVPFSERIIFVPHCLRNSKKCKAKEIGSYYICSECGACKINSISKKSKELGYKGLFILKGGKTIEKLTSEFEPKAILGISCFFEGAQAIELLKDKKIAVQFVPLSKDGCVDTDVILEDVFKILK
ncbi:DUF116 domain-containing protein [Elusimicrobiota bacterium]